MLMVRSVVVVCLCVLSSAQVLAAFGGHPPLGPHDKLRRKLLPYDLIKLNYLGMNYCENLLDMRLNITSYTHLDSERNCVDAWNLQFPDDASRILETLVWEDQFSPVVRLELARRMVKGLIAAHIPGTKAYHFFRHRSGGKAFVISDDETDRKQGRLLLMTLNDEVEHGLRVGFRTLKDGGWSGVEQFSRTDSPKSPGSMGTIRSPRYWNESPFVIKRTYEGDHGVVNFAGRYWLSDEDMPFEFAFESSDAERLQIVIGEPGKPMPLLRDANTPGIIHLPDRVTTFTSADADRVFDRPDFNYFILRKPTAWASPGYSTALLVMWEGRPEKIEALAEKGFGEIRITCANDSGRAAGKVWLLPFQWVNHKDMTYIYRNAESFLKQGKLMHNGFPATQLVNAIPTGLAAGAYLLAKYGDPMAATARTHAVNAVDQIFDAEQEGMWFVRVFLPVKAATWMVKLGNEIKDRAMVDKYTDVLRRYMRKMLSAELGYDGKAWPSGWDHFNCAKAAWLAYDATGDKDYLAIYDRAMDVYTIDSKGIYRYGKPMEAPGGFETYSGALPMSVWGHTGKMERVDTLINLDVPNGWHYPEIPVRDTWHDGGAGPWAQDDSQPDFVGFCLKGANIPRDNKHVLPVGAFPIYDAAGNVTVTRDPIVDNEFFAASEDDVLVLPRDRAKMKHKLSSIALRPADKRYAVGPLTYRFDTGGVSGAGIDMRIKGGFQVSASPDGKRWFTRLDSWSEEFSDQSLDLSAFAGSPDELVQISRIDPADDGQYRMPGGKSVIERDHCRYVEPGGGFVYRLELPDVTKCCLELLLGNGYRVQCSADGKTWSDGLGARHPEVNLESDAAWLRMLDVTDYLGRDGTVYVRFSDLGTPESYGGRQAFLRRLTVYGVFDSGSVYVRLSDTTDGKSQPLTLDGVVFRTWTSTR